MNLDGEETERTAEFLGYMIIKVSFLAAATIAAYAISHKNSNSTRKQCTPIKLPSDNDDSNFQQQKNEVIESTNQLESVAEVEDLHNVVKELQQRKLRFQRKLLELYGLKEEQSYIVHLQRRLKDKSAEIDVLNGTIASLQTEMKVLMEDAEECVEAKKQLETAKKMIDGLQKKVMESNESNMKMKRRFSMVEEQVSRFPNEENCVRDGIVEKKLKAVKDVEIEVLKMKRRNKELELEKRELAVKLVSAQERISSLASITVSETIAKVEKEVRMLRHNNDELLKQVEKLQKNRFDMVQELVYQRWLYACLRFETQIQNRNTSAKETLKDDDLSDGIDTTTTIEDSCSSSRASSTTPSKNKKSGFMQSIKRWGRSRDETRTDSGNALIKRGLVRRFSTSMVPVKTSILRTKGDSTSSSSSPSSKTSTLSKGRRVSFSDSVKSTDQYSLPTKSVDQKCDSRSAITMNSTQNHSNELEAEIDEPASPAVSFSSKLVQLGNERVCNTKALEEVNHPNTALAQTRFPKFIKDDSNTNDISNTMLVSVPEENRVDKSAVDTFGTLLLLLFISLVGCLYILFR